MSLGTSVPGSSYSSSGSGTTMVVVTTDLGASVAGDSCVGACVVAC